VGECTTIGSATLFACYDISCFSSQDVLRMAGLKLAIEEISMIPACVTMIGKRRDRCGIAYTKVLYAIRIRRPLLYPGPRNRASRAVLVWSPPQPVKFHLVLDAIVTELGSPTRPRIIAGMALNLVDLGLVLMSSTMATDLNVVWMRMNNVSH
jgi:hypothetical protein